MSTSKDKIISRFDPNTPGEMGKLFGLPFDQKHSEIIIIPVPWEVTVSYKSGTVDGPKAILQASSQVDLLAFDIQDAWKLGICMDEIKREIREKSTRFRKLAESHINHLEDKSMVLEEEIPEKVDSACGEMISYVKDRSGYFLAQNKIVAVVGGDHSTPLGLLEALSSSNNTFGILQIDAHADLRKRYENFKYSHASIMYNALKLENIEKLVQVGIRDYCQEEADFIKDSGGRINTFLYPEMKERVFEGEAFSYQIKKIINELPEKVYVSFDIDGLDPSLCPYTGTPVPGGLSFEEARYLIKEVVLSGRKIIGFDLCEVAPSHNENEDWDSNVGARVLYFLANYTGVSQGLLKLK